MKKIISIIAGAVMLLAINTANSQTIADFKKMTVEQKAQLITDSLKSNLNLTSTQYSQVHTGVLDALNKVMPIMVSDGSRREKGSKIIPILKDSMAKLKVILTPQQYSVFETKKKNLIAYYRHNFQSQKLIFNAPKG